MVQAQPTNAKDIVLMMGAEMQKDFSNVVQILEDNFIESIDELLELTPDQCKAINIPLGLINKIKKKAATFSANPKDAIQKAQ